MLLSGRSGSYSTRLAGSQRGLSLKGGFKYNKVTLGCYLLHLILFQFWLSLFFFLHEVFPGVILIVITSIILTVSVGSMYKRSRVAAGIMSLRWLWTGYMTACAIGVWWLNAETV